MADTSLDFKYVKDVSTMIKNLEGVNAATLPELSGVVNALYTFLQMLDSQDTNWQKLKHRLHTECPNFIPKLQYSFIYYYAMCLEKRYVPNDEVIKSSKQLSSNVSDFVNQITKSTGAEVFKYFKNLFSGKFKSIEANELAVNFIEDTFSLQGDLLGIGKFSVDPSHMTIEDFFNTFQAMTIDASEEEKISYLTKMRHSETPELKAFALISEAIVYSSIYGGTINSCNSKSKISEAIEEIEVEEFSRALKLFISDYGGLEITPKNVDTLQKNLNEILQHQYQQKKFLSTADSKEEALDRNDQYLADIGQTTGNIENLAAKIGKWVLQQYPGEDLKSFLNQNMNAQPKL